jgi:prophage regulatory protein
MKSLADHPEEGTTRSSTPRAFDALPDNGFIREAELVRTGSNPTGLLPFSSHTLWRKVREGSFPHPLKLAARVTAWRVSDIRSWMEVISK